MPYLPLHTKDNRCKIAELFARINAKRAMFRLLPESARKADSRYSPPSSILRYACITLCEIAIPRLG